MDEEDRFKQLSPMMGTTVSPLTPQAREMIAWAEDELKKMGAN